MHHEEAQLQLLGLPGACSSGYQASTPAFTPQPPQFPPDAPKTNSPSHSLLGLPGACFSCH
eukprot:3146642-Rhodomonas_salina.1